MQTLIAALALLVQATPTAAPPPPAPLPAVGAPLRLAQAQAVVEAALADARRKGFVMAVSVVEPDGTLVAFARIDGAPYSATGVSQAKARSAALYRRATLVFSQAAKGSAGVLSLPDVVAVEGGVPLVLDGRMVGAVGVSGGSADQDGGVAAAGAAALR